MVKVGPQRWPGHNGRYPIALSDAETVLAGTAVELMPCSLLKQMEQVAREEGVQLRIHKNEDPGSIQTLVLQVDPVLDPVAPESMRRLRLAEAPLNEACGLQLHLEAGQFDDNLFMAMLMYKPAARAVALVLEHLGCTEALLMGHELFALPFLFAGPKYMKSLAVKTFLYSGQLHLATELIDEQGTEVFVYDAIARGENPLQRHHDNPLFQLLSVGHQCNYLAAVGALAKEELSCTNRRAYRDRSFHVVPHGIDIHESRFPSKTAAKRELLRRMSSNGMIAPYSPAALLLLKIARPDRCKAFDRDALLAEELDVLLRERGQNGLMLFVSHWPPDALESPNRRVLPRETLVSVIDEMNSRLTNITAVLEESFDFPNRLDLSRADLLQAADVTLSQSRYDSFGLSQLEGLPHGAVATIGTSTGAYHWLMSHRHRAASVCSSIVFANYYEHCRAALIEGHQTLAHSEREVAKRIAHEVLQKLNIPPEVRVHEGRRLIEQVFSWKLAERELQICLA